MNNNLKKSALLVLAAGLLSCSNGNNPTNRVTNYVPVILSSSFTYDLNKNNLRSGKKGATITVKLAFAEEQKTFAAKSNVSGSAVSGILHIKSYQVYLLKNSSLTGYPVGGDPEADKVADPIIFNRADNSSDIISLVNVPGSSGKAYYVAVRAWNGPNATGNELIKPNAALASSPQMAISSGAGITVSDTSLAVNSTAALTITTNLLDAVGATLENKINLNSGSSVLSPVSTSVFPIILKNIAGTGTAGNAPVANSVATSTALNSPNGVAVDAAGNIYIANTTNHTIRKVTPAGIMSTIAGTGTSGNAPVADSVATSTILNSPRGVAVDAAGNVYIANTSNHSIRKVTPAGIMSTIAGTGTAGNTSVADSVATSTALNSPRGVAVDAAGNVYIANTSNHSIRKVTPAGIMSTTAGTGTAGNAPVADSVATSTALFNPNGIAIDAAGNVYIANSSNQTIRKVTPAGIMSTIAGTGTSDHAPVADSVATSTTLFNPNGIAIDAAGNIYIANSSNHTIRKVTPAGIMSTIAGTGTSGHATVADSVATSTALNSPLGIAIDAAGNIYIANTTNHSIRKVF